MRTGLLILQDKHALLSEKFKNLGIELIIGSEDLAERGLPPTESLISNLGLVRQEFSMLTEEVINLATSAALPPNDHVPSMHELAQVLQHLNERYDLLEEVHTRSVSSLEKVLNLTHRYQPDFAPLHECQALAREILRKLQDREANQSQVVMEVDVVLQPFFAILTLVEKGEELEDERWDQLQETIAFTFGKALSIATMRGRIILGSEESASTFRERSVNEGCTYGNGHETV